MASGQFIPFDKAKLRMLDATNLLNTANTFKLTLHTSSFTPSASMEVYADLTNELSTANGYTSGGNTLSGVALTLIAAQTISSITKSGTTATLTTGSAHGLSTGMYVTIKDAVDVLYNGTFPITVTSSTVFTYVMTSTPASNASVVGTYGSVIKWTCSATVFTASGGSIPVWRWAVIRASNTLNSLVGPLFGYFLGDTTPADIPATTSGNTLTITPNTAGVSVLT